MIATTPTYSITPIGWAASKTVTIDYQTSSYTKQYLTNGGTTWTSWQTGKTYMFSGLTNFSYGMRVQVKNNANLTTSTVTKTVIQEVFTSSGSFALPTGVLVLKF